MTNVWILQFLGAFLGSSKKPFYKVNRANGQILYRLSVTYNGSDIMARLVNRRVKLSIMSS